MRIFFLNVKPGGEYNPIPKVQRIHLHRQCHCAPERWQWCDLTIQL